MTSLDLKDEKVSSPAYAGFIRRTLAFVVDELIIAVIFYILIILIDTVLGKQSDIIALSKNRGFHLAFLAFYLLYNAYFVYKFSATIGKKILGIKVVDVDFKKLNLKQVLIRETIGKIASWVIYYLGFLSVVYDKYKQAWHDKLAKTYVVYLGYNKNIKDEKLKLHPTLGDMPVLLLAFGIVEATFMIGLTSYQIFNLKAVTSGTMQKIMPFYIATLIFSAAQLICGLALRLQSPPGKRSRYYNLLSSIFFVVIQFVTYYLFFQLRLIINRS